MKIEYKFGFGDIYRISQDAIIFAKKNLKRNGEKVEVFFIFNGLEINATSSSDPQDLVEKYYLQNTIRRLKAGYKD